MAVSVKDLRPGDLLVSNIGEVYCYLGFFEGAPYSMYNVPDFGHMYLFCDRWDSFGNSLFYCSIVNREYERVKKLGGMLSPQASTEIVKKNWDRLRSSFDGNARYSKSYARFEALVGHCEIPDRVESLSYVYGCKRLGDRKPRGYKGYASF